MSLGLGGGTLACNGFCQYDVGQCGVCGDNFLDSPPEECDGMAFGDATCQTEGFAMGTLACQVDCTLDTSGCSGVSPDSGPGPGTDAGPPPPVCGNGTTEPPEECDDGNTTNGDGCSSTCMTEGPTCVPDGGACMPTGTPCCAPFFCCGATCCAG
jgi:cysteine-rich repeat protein